MPICLAISLTGSVVFHRMAAAFRPVNGRGFKLGRIYPHEGGIKMEALGKVHPSHRNYHKWDQSSANEKEAQLRDMAFCYTEIAKLYGHDAIFVHPDGLHSLDPQGGVDLKLLKRKYNDKVCLVGNVNCGLLQTGTDEEAAADVRRALRDGMPGYGYIFSTSNCVYTALI